jgi:MoaA/NifB/PqqE/SkfB family radical SAM enzyme
MAADTLQTHLTQRNPRIWRLHRERKLNTIIFFVTSHCNATCETCFYWDELNQKGDLSWDEIVKLSLNTPPFTDLWFSGGEPTLRQELPQIIDLFVRNNGVRYINLPTNGLKPNRIFEIAEHALSKNRDLELHVNIALDGLRESHDFMRGVPGNFEKPSLNYRHTVMKPVREPDLKAMKVVSYDALGLSDAARAYIEDVRAGGPHR